jgi:arylsulfatase A-like enzyme
LIDAPASVIDVAPTALRFLGHPSNDMDGQPLQRL